MNFEPVQRDPSTASYPPGGNAGSTGDPHAHFAAEKALNWLAVGLVLVPLVVAAAVATGAVP